MRGRRMKWEWEREWERACPLEWDFCCPCGHGSFFFVLYLGRLRGERRGGLLGAAAPPRPPLHSPRTTPLGFPYSANRQITSALTSVKPFGFSICRMPARAARLLLRELPSLRSGDLPARRAMPAFAFSLNVSLKTVVPCHVGRKPYHLGQTKEHHA